MADTHPIERTPTQLAVATSLRALPSAVVAGLVWALAWNTSGSIEEGDWLPYAVGASLVLAVVLLSGVAVRPAPLALAAAGLLAIFAAWTAISIVWSPLPALARSDALLVAFYLVAFLLPLVTIRSEADRLAAAAVAVAGLGSLAIATLVEARFSAHPDDLYLDGRLVFPVSYANGEAALALVGLWPAIALAARRSLPALARALALGGATAMLACLLLAQSKGGALALGVSAIVFFAVAPARLRALLPAAIAAAVAAIGIDPLTAPYRAAPAELASSIRHAGGVALVLTVVGAAVGLVYALADRRLTVARSVERLAGRALVLVLAGCVLAGVAVFFARVHHPLRFADDKWRDFKHIKAVDTASSHFTSLGSNRYDFWRVALDEFVDHPIAGIGDRGWAAAYLQHGRSLETPERSHSVELDAVSETGVVGLLLLVGGAALAFAAVRRRARTSLTCASALAAGAYFAAHASVDWIWTIPEVGLPAFLLMGIGAAGDRPELLPGRAAVPAGVAAVVLALAAFAPPWLSTLFVDRAYDASTATAAADDLRWARRLDPLSVDPLLAEAALASPAGSIGPLERAVAKQPRDAEVHYLLGLAYLSVGKRADARAQLARAHELSPRDSAIRGALRRAERASRRG